MTTTTTPSRDSEKATELMEALTTEVEALRTSEGWMAWLRYAAQFHNYSLGNQLLIQWQCPHATQVTGYGAKDGSTGWLKLGRQVRKGERAIHILAPKTRWVTRENKDGEEERVKIVSGFRTVAVFDVSQTDGDELPKGPGTLWTEAVAAIAAEHPGEADQVRYDTLEAAAEALGFTVVREAAAAPGEALGWWPRGSQSLHVCEGDPRTMAATLAHEMSHALDPEIGTCDYATGELVAESSAHIVSAVLGLDTTPVSTAYLAGWSKGADSLRQVAERALKIANQIINATGIEEAA